MCNLRFIFFHFYCWAPSWPSYIMHVDMLHLCLFALTLTLPCISYNVSYWSVTNLTWLCFFQKTVMQVRLTGAWTTARTALNLSRPLKRQLLQFHNLLIKHSSILRGIDLKVEQERLAVEKERLIIDGQRLVLEQQKGQLYITKLNLTLSQMGIHVGNPPSKNA